MRGLALNARMMSKPSVAVLGSGPTAAAAKAAVGEWATVTDSANSAPYVLVVDGAPGSVKADAVVAVPTCADAAKLAAAVPTAKVVAVTAAPAVAAAAELASKARAAPTERSLRACAREPPHRSERGGHPPVRRVPPPPNPSRLQGHPVAPPPCALTPSPPAPLPPPLPAGGRGDVRGAPPLPRAVREETPSP